MYEAAAASIVLLSEAKFDPIHEFTYLFPEGCRIKTAVVGPAIIINPISESSPIKYIFRVVSLIVCFDGGRRCTSVPDALSLQKK